MNSDTHYSPTPVDPRLDQLEKQLQEMQRKFNLVAEAIAQFEVCGFHLTGHDASCYRAQRRIFEIGRELASLPGQPGARAASKHDLMNFSNVAKNLCDLVNADDRDSSRDHAVFGSEDGARFDGPTN